MKQTLTIARASFRRLGKPRLALAAIPLLTLIVALDRLNAGDVPRIPTTAVVLSKVTASLTDVLSPWIILPLLLIFFAGELVWQERDAGMAELTDALPTPQWPRFLGKFLALGLVLAVVMTGIAAGGMLAQAILGGRHFDLALYAKLLFGLQLPAYLLFALLVLVLHVVVNQKYLGHLAAIAACAFLAKPSLFGVEHSLLVYGAGPRWSYTEMRGFGASLAPWAWFQLYWAGWALLLAAAAQRRFTRATKRVAGVAVVLILGIGGFVFYNTNVLNEYYTKDEYQELLAEYERRYGRYEGIEQPRLAATRLHVEIHPGRRVAEIQGTYDLVNRGTAAIDSVHVALIPGATTRTIAFDRAAAPIVTDDVRGHRIYQLAKPLQPGEAVRLRFEVHVAPRGFSLGGVHEFTVVKNGTFFTNEDWLPAIGYQPNRELKTPGDRRKHGLPPRPLIAALQDTKARMTPGERTTFEAVIGTDADQVGVAPGVLRRTWTSGSRRYFHYATDGPIGNEYVFFSARYAVREARWKNVAIRIFHHPTHTANLDRFVRSIQASLDYYTREYGPYPYGHLTFVENRGNELGMRAYPSLVRYAEETALLNPGDGPGSLDLPFDIVAHEVSHQWWGHGLEPAFVEGAPVVGEGLAVYSAMRVVEATQGRDSLRRYLAFMRQPYPYAPIRRGEPLLRGMDPYLSYRKAPFALHALSEAIGPERVNTALRLFFETHPPGTLPRATTLDLYRELQAVTPAAARPLLHDLFEVNTSWHLTLQRATAVPAGPNAWQVTLEVQARKVVTDSEGVEAAVPMDEWVEVGVFGAKLSEPLYVQKHRIRSGKQTLTVTVPRKPALAGIDAFHVLDWEEKEDDDNVAGVGSGVR